MKNLKKFFVWMLAIVGIAAFGFAGCGKNASVKVTAYVYDSTQEQYVVWGEKTVDAHNNLLLSSPETDPPAGKEFYGWSTSQNWQEDSTDFVIQGNQIVYNKISGAAKNGELKLYPAYKNKIEFYFVFGVAVASVSGVDADKLNAIRTALLAYLGTQGATENQLALVDVRQYEESGVADYGAHINRDGDVDVFLGSGNNIDATSGTTGNVETYAKTAGFEIAKGETGSKTGRRFVLLNQDNLSVNVYNWFVGYIYDNYDDTFNVSTNQYTKEACTVTFDLGDHAGASAQPITAIETYKDARIELPEAPVVEEGYMFTGWKVGTDTTLKQPGTRIRLAATGNLTITAQYRSGFAVTYSKGLVTRTAATEDPEAATSLADGAVVTLPAAPAAKAVFTFAGWKVCDDAVLKEAGSQITVHDDLEVVAQYNVDTTAVDNTTIILGYLAKTSASGLSDTDGIMDNVLVALKNYLTSIGIINGHENITVRAYTNNASVAKTDVDTDVANGDNVGVAVGFNDTHHPTSVADTAGYTLGIGEAAKTSRSVHLISASAINNIVYDWMVTNVGPSNGTFGGVEGITMPA